MCKIEISRVYRIGKIVPFFIPGSKGFLLATENAFFPRECLVRSAIIRLRGRGHYKFRWQSRCAILPGRAYTCAYEGSMQNVSSRYRLKHKFLKRCDTRTPRHNLTNGASREGGAVRDGSNLRKPRNIVSDLWPGEDRSTRYSSHDESATTFIGYARARPLARSHPAASRSGFLIAKIARAAVID